MKQVSIDIIGKKIHLYEGHEEVFTIMGITQETSADDDRIYPAFIIMDEKGRLSTTFVDGCIVINK